MQEATQPFTDRVRQNLDVLDRMSADGKIDLVRAVKAAEDIEAAAQAMLGPAIAILRSCGKTWQDVGNQLGISRQAAQQRFGRHLKAWEDSVTSDSRSALSQQYEEGPVPACSAGEAAARSWAARDGARGGSTGPQRRRRLAERRLRSRVLDGFLRLTFEDGPEREWNLPPREAHDAIARLSLEAQAWAESHCATHGQQKAVHRALTEAGYYNTGPRR